jgi:dTDP-4-amino-4,6-dideoxygalactose transaminase
MNPHEITKAFEQELCNYTGAQYACAVTSCTMALLLAVRWRLQGQANTVPFQWKFRPEISIPKRTYVSVPMSIYHAGGLPVFRDESWSGAYELAPLKVWDCARRFRFDMYVPGDIQCVSFHASKILGDSQGGAILHNDERAQRWFTRARFDGRSEGIPPNKDTFTTLGWHCYLSPDVSARLLWKLQRLPLYNDDLPNDDYPDLSVHPVFIGMQSN